MSITERKEIISNYIDGYNKFDIEKMVANFDEHIEFENISNGETNMSLIGLRSFIEQAELAKNYFSKRVQTIKSFSHQNDQTEIEIIYYAVLGTDLPNGLKKGEELNIEGRSIFKFKGGKIIKLTDIS